MYGLGNNEIVNSLLVTCTTYPVCVTSGWLMFPELWGQGGEN